MPSTPVHKTFKEKLRPTPAQEAALDVVLWRCRTLYNTALEQRISVWRQRRDFHHKTALAVVRQYDTIYHEELRVANLVRNPHLAKSISDAGWGAFLTILAFKAASAGKQVVAVDPAFTSQMCSGCGAVVQKGLSVRWHSCPACGTSLHRDHNAAKNIQGRGQRLRGLAGLPAGMNREPVGL